MTSDSRWAELAAAVREFAEERDWEQFHDPKSLAMAIASEAGELLSELRWVPSEKADEVVRNAAKRKAIETEAADIWITLTLFCARCKIDLAAAVQRKLKVNAEHYPPKESRGRSGRPNSADA